MLRTPTVYASSGVSGTDERDEVVAAVQLRDAHGNTEVERAGLALRLVLSGSSGTTSAACPQVDETSGLATCRATVPAGWFSTDSAGSANATVRLEYGGELVLEQAAGAVALARSPAHGALGESGMTLQLPGAPLFAGDSLVARVRASLVGVSYGLMAWTIALAYDSCSKVPSTLSEDSAPLAVLDRL